MIRRGLLIQKCLLHFQIKDLEFLQYFLGIEVTKSMRISLFQRKYVLDMLSEAGMLGCRAFDVLKDANVNLLQE